MRTLIGIIITLIVLATVATGTYFYVQLIISRLNFKFDLPKIDLSQISLTNPTIRATIPVTVDNQNPFQIPFTNLFVKLYSNGRLIAQSEKIDTNKYVVPEKNSLTFFQTLDVYVSLNTINDIKNIISKKQTRIDYEISLQVFGINIPNAIVPPIKDYFTLPL